MIYIILFSILVATIIMFFYMNKNDSWKILIGYSSIATKLVILLIFLKDLINAQYLSSILIIFLLLSSGGTIIAAYFLGAKE
ncbi:MAG: hypothetical protein PWQ77_137 [Kosmotogales bacterium]|nr:hypothetical protein [Kosmotogales bacterium]